MKFITKYGKIIFLILSGLFFYHIGYQIARSDFKILSFDFSILFALYFFAYKYLSFDWFSVIFLRLVLIACTPSLSDDYFRFIWDGQLMVNGLNPFQFLPSELPKNEIFEGLNSKNYYSVYPPLLQLIFGFGAWVGNGNILANIIALRTVIILADLGVIYLIIKLLNHFKINKNQVQLYALNPLIILELTGNLHFEAVMLFFLILVFYILLTKPNNTKNILLSAIALAAGALIKLIPLMFIPLIINKLGWKKGMLFSLIVSLIMIFAFITFINTEIIFHILNSLNLYFQKFEFNASIYYLVRWLGIFVNNNNPIQLAGPLLALISFFIILWVSLKKIDVENTGIQFITRILIILSIYFIFATTVHPWYLTSLVLLGSFTQFKFPIVWSAVTFFSYSAYRIEGFHENIWLVIVEYTLVFGFIYFELKTKKLDSI